MARLDDVYHAQRAQLTERTQRAAAAHWRTTHEDRAQCIGDLVTLVQAAQAQMVALVDVYMSLKVGVPQHGLDPERYTDEQLRGVRAGDVYSRVWGAYYAALSEAEDDTGRAGDTGGPRLTVAGD